jgi:hypothetical protein
MWEGPNLYRMLEAEWKREADSPAARGACARWASADAVLEGIASPAEVVRHCQMRGHNADSAAVLGAVLRHAGADRWAARTVLQAVLPGLAALSRRARPLVRAGGVWQSIDEVDQYLVANAYDRIIALADEASPACPAAAIINATWTRLRHLATKECRRAASAVGTYELGDLEAIPQTTASGELAQTLADAVERGVLEQADGRLVLASRVLGQPMEAMADELGYHPGSLWRRRRRAEQRLQGARPLLVAVAGG